MCIGSSANIIERNDIGRTVPVRCPSGASPNYTGSVGLISQLGLFGSLDALTQRRH